ncbi:prespore-specific regulator [Evansella caseinilytica]|uniref:Prespore-specific regulator n=1 Tax=Evansella caseinilytica TaxID=1503961 RepID=A0A1H3MIY8_9BACI|nr:RsfA family transcriptional regulator [Evansella caseinilytica]SDY76536.1 prespore-specific regulator [Evansella caseinilytica]
MVRQDAWNQDEDLLLAEVVLRHVREGSTQLAAFEEVGEKLSRTPAACGFRWNSSIRKKYESAIQLAKKQRKQLRNKGTMEPQAAPTVNAKAVKASGSRSSKSIVQIIDEMVQFLLEKKEEINSDQSQQWQDEQSALRMQELAEENQQLTSDLTKLKHEYDMIKTDYQLMIHVMERATKRNQNHLPAK